MPATFVVTNGGDNGGIDPAPFAGTGTLRQAIVDAQQTLADGDEIVIPLDVRFIDLEAPLPTLVETHTIRAEMSQFSPRATIRPTFGVQRTFRFIDVVPNGSTTTLENLNLNHFGAQAGTFDTGDGGTIRTDGPLVMTNCAVFDSHADGNGGAIATGNSASLGHLTLTDCAFEQTFADGNGGVIYSQPSFSAPILNLTRTTFTDTVAYGSGGGIYFVTSAGTLTLVDCGFTCLAYGSGGGIYQSGGQFSITGPSSGFGSCVASGGAGGGICLINPDAATIDAGFAGCNASSPALGQSIYIFYPSPPAAISINYARVFNGTVVIVGLTHLIRLESL